MNRLLTFISRRHFNYVDSLGMVTAIVFNDPWWLLLVIVFPFALVSTLLERRYHPEYRK